MSMELIVILALQRAPALDSWQKALRAEHIPIQFTESVDLRKHEGFLPLTLHGRSSGFEFSVRSYAEYVSVYKRLPGTYPGNPIVYSFEYGGDPGECASVFYAAEALVVAFGGVAFDPQGNSFMEADSLANMARTCDKWASNK